MGKGRFRLNYRILANLLGMGPEAKIVAIDTDWRGYAESLEIYVEHPDFQEYEEGCMIPRINPCWREGVEFIDWGIEEKE